ncbi:hypothetical protein [Roseococcus sp. YIM B11640]|uniref:hypothetical protein n=1 Tax=Roseococcus sp. YIM B11640 TaxID=3133973 RepID=UPI003C7D25BF
MPAGPSYVISFYFHREGDLPIPSVHWSGSLRDAEDWGRERLVFLAERPKPIRRPNACRVRSFQGELISTWQVPSMALH